MNSDQKGRKLRIISFLSFFICSYKLFFCGLRSFPNFSSINTTSVIDRKLRINRAFIKRKTDIRRRSCITAFSKLNYLRRRD